MQHDGNFVAYNCLDVPIFELNTDFTNANLIVLRDDGNLVLYRTEDPLHTSGFPGTYEQRWTSDSPNTC